VIIETNGQLEDIPEITSKRDQSLGIDRNRNLGRDSSELTLEAGSYNASKKYSATGGTGGENGSSLNRRLKNPSKVLGDYHMTMINKAFADF
jgi:hypothetical protein